jgi:glycosyltransferase involved in cell wall biosynthesis
MMRAGQSPARTILVAHPSAELYGSDRVLLESVSAFVEAGWRVVTTLPSGGPLVDELRARGSDVVLCTAPVVRKSALRPAGFARFLGTGIAGFVSGLRLLRREHPQVVYVSTLTIPLWVLLARLCGLRVIAHVHEAERSAPAIQRNVLAFPLLFAQTIVSNSRFSADVLASSFRSLGKRAKILNNGVPGPANPEAARAHLVDALRVTYVGRLSPRKGVDVAVDAVALLNDNGVPADLTLLGAVFPGYEWYEQQLRDQVARLGLADKVRFMGFQPNVWGIIAEGDVVVVPSRIDEPFGNTAVEAILAARPVVASATSGLLEATSGFESARTVTPDDPAALASALTVGAKRWEEWREEALRDLPVAEARHSPASYRTRIVELLDETSTTRATVA